MSEYKQSKSLDYHVFLPEPERITVCGIVDKRIEVRAVPLVAYLAINTSRLGGLCKQCVRGVDKLDPLTILSVVEL